MIQPTTALATILATMRRALLAQDCVLCAAPSGDEALCHACAAELPALGPHCPQCANAVTADQHCGACLVAPPAFDATLAVWRYTYPLDRLVQALKYGGRLALADGFGRALASRVAAHATAIDLIVPMPLHEKRLRARGFNQAVEIARALARCGGKTAIDTRALVRRRDTPAQAGLPHDARAGNVRGAFACTVPLDGMRIALIDDVMTTGATADAAARALKRAGAAHVENWVVARAMTGL
jgi:ComF family protein